VRDEALHSHKTTGRINAFSETIFDVLPDVFLFIIIIIKYVMELGHLLTRSVLTYPEVSS